jgi:hypothetical protein
MGKQKTSHSTLSSVGRLFSRQVLSRSMLSQMLLKPKGASGDSCLPERAIARHLECSGNPDNVPLTSCRRNVNVDPIRV